MWLHFLSFGLMLQTPSDPQKVASLPSPQCRKGNPLEGVSNPLRLRVISDCEVGSGIVRSVNLLDDGDWRIDVSLSPQYWKLLDVGNVSHQNGWLVLELIPRDQATISVPPVGKQITLVGPLVYDLYNYWNARHCQLFGCCLVAVDSVISNLCSRSDSLHVRRSSYEPVIMG